MTLRTDFLRLMKIMEMMLGVVMGVVDMEVDKWPMRWRTGPTLLM